MTDERDPQDHARELARELFQATRSIENTGDFSIDEDQFVEFFIAKHTASQLAGAVPHIKHDANWKCPTRHQWLIRDDGASGEIRYRCQGCGDLFAPIGELRNALVHAEAAMQSAWHELEPGPSTIGCQFIRQDDMSEVLALVRKTLEASDEAGLPMVDPKETERTHQPGAVPQEELRKLWEKWNGQAEAHLRSSGSQMKVMLVSCAAELESLVEKRRVKS